ncbi:MAG: hypothetical protein EHM77_02620 [Planctomycetaceae bacterium]|nr:MAG: hypothetical protein EHM77_02620 [Planctomycetaceae bacterium]
MRMFSTVAGGRVRNQPRGESRKASAKRARRPSRHRGGIEAVVQVPVAKANATPTLAATAPRRHGATLQF